MQQQKEKDDKLRESLSARVARLETQLAEHQCPTVPREIQQELRELKAIHIKCGPALTRQMNSAQDACHELQQLQKRWEKENDRVKRLEEHIQRLEVQLENGPQSAVAVQEMHRQFNDLQSAHSQCSSQIMQLRNACKETRIEKESLVRKDREHSTNKANSERVIGFLHQQLEDKENECQALTRERIFLRDQLERVRRPIRPPSVHSDEQSDRRSEHGPRGFSHYEETSRPVDSNFLDIETELPRRLRKLGERVRRQCEREDSSIDEEYYPKKAGKDKRRKSSSESNRSPTPPRRPTERKHRKGKGRGGGESPSSSNSSSDDEHPLSRSRPRRRSGSREKHREDTDKTLKNIKSVRLLLHPYSKNGKVSIQDHVTLYVKYMSTFHMDTDRQLIKYLSWTFASDSQAFFIARDVREFKKWRELRREVVKHFSPHRNKQEALQFALSRTCGESQHPREFLQILKNAFGQAYEVVRTESSEFKDTFFFGLPQTMRVQMARDYNSSRRSLGWILEQAVNIYEVSKPTEKEGKDQGKTRSAAPSKVHEITADSPLPLEGAKKLVQKDGTNETVNAKPAQKQKKDEKPREGGGNTSSAPSQGASDFFISARYKGNKPIPNYMFRNSQSRQGSVSPPSERRGDNRPASGENRETNQQRPRQSQGRYEGSPERRQYSGDGYRSQNESRGRSEERYRQVPNEDRFAEMERQIRDLCNAMNQRNSQSAEQGRSRANSESVTPSNQSTQE